MGVGVGGLHCITLHHIALHCIVLCSCGLCVCVLRLGGYKLAYSRMLSLLFHDVEVERGIEKKRLNSIKKA